LAEVRNGLEVRRQLPGQPDHLDVALAFPLQASARWHAIEVAVDVELEHNAGVIAGPAGVERLDTHEPELVEIETVDEHVDRSHWVILAYIIIERRWEPRSLPAIHPFDKALHLMPRKSQGILSRESPQTERFHTAWAQPGPSVGSSLTSAA